MSMSIVKPSVEVQKMWLCSSKLFNCRFVWSAPSRLGLACFTMSYSFGYILFVYIFCTLQNWFSRTTGTFTFWMPPLYSVQAVWFGVIFTIPNTHAWSWFHIELQKPNPNRGWNLREWKTAWNETSLGCNKQTGHLDISRAISKCLSSHSECFVVHESLEFYWTFPCLPLLPLPSLIKNWSAGTLTCLWAVGCGLLDFLMVSFKAIPWQIP